jgi:hypothetical protein
MCPPESFSAGQFTTDLDILDDAYRMGQEDGQQFLQNWAS